MVFKRAYKRMENGMFWSEIRSGFKEPGGTSPLRNPRRFPPPPAYRAVLNEIKREKWKELLFLNWSLQPFLHPSLWLWYLFFLFNHERDLDKLKKKLHNTKNNDHNNDC